MITVGILLFAVFDLDSFGCCILCIPVAKQYFFVVSQLVPTLQSNNCDQQVMIPVAL
jgi:hypothetical protein